MDAEETLVAARPCAAPAAGLLASAILAPLVAPTLLRISFTRLSPMKRRHRVARLRCSVGGWGGGAIPSKPLLRSSR